MRRQAAVAVLVAAAIVIGLWSAPPTTTPASVTIDLQRLPVGAATDVSWQARKAFAGVAARGELDRRRQEPDQVMALVGVSPDGKYELARQDDRVVWVLRADTGYPLFDLVAGTGSIRRVAWEPDGNLVLDIWHSGQAASVRCTLARTCERAGGSTTRKTPPRVTKVMLKTSTELTSGVHLAPEQNDVKKNDDRITRRPERTQQISQTDPPADHQRRPTTPAATDQRRARDWMSAAVEQYLRAHADQYSYDFGGVDDGRSGEEYESSERDSSERDGEYDGWSRDSDDHDWDYDWDSGYSYGDHHR
ncbi:WD40 repeat domain-containing protein [Flindersiella endophytica]